METSRLIDDRTDSARISLEDALRGVRTERSTRKSRRLAGLLNTALGAVERVRRALRR